MGLTDKLTNITDDVLIGFAKTIPSYADLVNEERTTPQKPNNLAERCGYAIGLTGHSILTTAFYVKDSVPTLYQEGPLSDICNGAGSHFFPDQTIPDSISGKLGYTIIDVPIKSVRTIGLLVKAPYIAYKMLIRE